MQDLVSDFDVLPFDLPSDELAQDYVKRGVFPEKYVTDANHVAVAATNGIGYIVSWNFAHLVKVQTKRGVNLVHALMGYEPIEIIAPPEL